MGMCFLVAPSIKRLKKVLGNVSNALKPGDVFIHPLNMVILKVTEMVGTSRI